MPISPWRDPTLTKPDLPAVEARDPWLSIAGTREAGTAWVDGDDPTDPTAQPAERTEGEHGPDPSMLGASVSCSLRTRTRTKERVSPQETARMRRSSTARRALIRALWPTG